MTSIRDIELTREEREVVRKAITASLERAIEDIAQAREDGESNTAIVSYMKRRDALYAIQDKLDAEQRLWNSIQAGH